MFTIGGLSGVSHAFAPADTQQTDTYYIVAHFHYVLFGGALLGLFGGMYFWWPKIFGHFLGEKLGKWHFWVILVGFNLTFGPQHILGLQGMMRRTWTYTEDQGFNTWNLVSTIGALTIAVALIIFMVNVALSYRKHRRNPVDPGPDPWDARSLEWMIPSPTPEHNFDEVPVVEEFDEFWHRKYGHDENGRLVRIAKTEDVVQDRRRDRRAPAVAVVLAARARRRHAAGRVRAHLQPLVGDPRRGARHRRCLRLGHGAVDRPRRGPPPRRPRRTRRRPRVRGSRADRGRGGRRRCDADDAATDDAAVSADAVTTEEAPVG